MAEELKMLQKIFDMMEYGYMALAQFPKSEKYALATDIKRCMDLILERQLGLPPRLPHRQILSTYWVVFQNKGIREMNVIRSYLGFMKHCDCDAFRDKVLKDFVLVRRYADEQRNKHPD